MGKKYDARGLLLLALKILLSAALVYFLARRFSFAEAAEYLLHVRPLPALGSLALLGVSIGLSGWRWFFAAGGNIRCGVCLRYSWIGHLYAMILPGALSADVAKGVVMKTKDSAQCSMTLAGSIIMDRVAGLGSMIVFGLLSCLARPELLHLPPVVLVGLAILGAVGLLLVPMMVRFVVRRFDRAERFPALHALMHNLHGHVWWKVLLLSVAIHCVNITVYWTGLMAVGGYEDWWQMGIYTCLLNLALVLPVSIAGVGLREQIAVMLFAASNNAPMQIAFGWLVLALNVVHAMIGLALQWGKGRSCDQQ